MKAINAKLFIQGYYAGNETMKPVANNQDSSQPTTDVEVVTATLYDNQGNEVEVSSGMLKTDGTVSFDFNSTGTFWLGVRGKNSLLLFAKPQITLDETDVDYDFTAQEENQAEVAFGVYAAFSGDINGDGAIDGDDESLLQAAIDAFANGVQPADLNGDGGVDNSDMDFLAANAGRTVAFPTGF